MTSENRNRRIVKLAAAQTSITSVKRWLIRDENAIWEKKAAELLDQTSEKAAELGLSAERVDAECASCIALLAVSAKLAHEKRNSF